MQGNARFDDKVEGLLSLGLRQRWYCIAPSAAIVDRPVAMTRLGERLVVWRDGAGLVHVQEDRCPHRGAPLSFGHVIDGRLTCRYHGVQVDGDGIVARVPAMPDCSLVGQNLLKTFPVIEHLQGIFVYFGNPSKPEPVAFELPYEMTSEDWGGFLVSAHWKVNQQYIWDNLNDPMHALALHGGTFTHVVSEVSDQVDVADTDCGFLLRRVTGSTTSFETMEYVDSGAQFWRFDVNYPAAAGPGGMLRIVCFVTPIDEHQSVINFWRLREVSGWRRDLWYFLYKAKLEDFSWQVLEQDREILELMPPWPPRENLYQHDMGVTRMRRLARREAEAQVRAQISALEEPVAAS